MPILCEHIRINKWLGHGSWFWVVLGVCIVVKRCLYYFVYNVNTWDIYNFTLFVYKKVAWSPSGWILTVFDKACLSCFWSSCELCKIRYIFVEGEIHLLSRLSYPSSPISAPVMRDITLLWWEVKMTNPASVTIGILCVVDLWLLSLLLRNKFLEIWYCCPFIVNTILLSVALHTLWVLL